MNRNTLYYLVILIALIFLFSTNARSEIITDVINTPTANFIEYGGIDMNFQGYLYTVNQDTQKWNNGGLVADFSYGFMDVLNIGISFDAGNIVSKEGLFTSAMHFRQPKLFMKLQLLMGTVPTAIGYDARGYRDYDSDTQQYEIREKGYYVVFSKVNITKALSLVNVGLNVCDFENVHISSFFGMMITLNKKLQVAGELDNGNRVNIGLHYLAAVESFSIDAGVKNVGTDAEYYLRFRVVRILQ